MASPIIDSRELSLQICKALGLDPGKTRRIVIDLSTNEPVTVYAEMYGDQKMLEIDWTAIYGAEVRFSDKDATDDYNLSRAMTG